VPKKGFGNKIARWLGGVFDTDWGYEYSTTTVFDEQATRQSAIKYLTTVIESYSSTCDKWSDSSATIINELCGHISVRRDAFQARQVEIADERAMMNVIENLEALITSIKDVKISKNNYVPHTETDLEIKLSNIKVSHAALAVYELAERVRQNIHKLTARHAGIGDGDINIVISWDALCTAMLLKNYFGITVSDEKLENGLTRFDNIVVIGKPSKELLESTAAEYSDRNVNWLVMFNAIQYGAALNAMHRSGLPEFIQKNDRLFLIVQDFRELCNADGVKDGLDNMKNVCRELNIESTPLILLNDNNPIYSLAAVQVQHTRCETHMDEVNLMNFIQDHFPYLLDPMAERTIHNIIQSL
jgi:molybdopterin converting factor small subunit